MKRKISYILPLLCSVLTVIAVTSCRKAPINGKLDGQWQVMTIEHLTEGRTETPHVATYIDLNLHVVNLRTATQAPEKLLKVAGKVKPEFQWKVPGW